MNNSLVCIDVYTVTAGDTLYTIADKYDLPVSLLMKVNCITNPYNLEIGTRLCIPGDESQLTKPEEKTNAFNEGSCRRSWRHLVLNRKETWRKIRRCHECEPKYRSI